MWGGPYSLYCFIVMLREEHAHTQAQDRGDVWFYLLLRLVIVVGGGGGNSV